MKKLFTLVVALMAFGATMVKADEYTLTLSDSNFVRLTDVTQSYGLYQWTGYTNDTSYYVYVAMNADSVTAALTPESINLEYTAIYRMVDGDPEEVVIKSMTSGSVVRTYPTGTTGFDAEYALVDSLGDTYYVSISYHVPYAATELNLNADTLVISTDQWQDCYDQTGYGFFGAQCMDTKTGMLFMVYLYSENPWFPGTYTMEDVYYYSGMDYIFVYQYTETDTISYSVYSADLTFAKTATNATLTGNVICYGDTKINITASADATAVENVEASQYQAYTEGRTIVLNGAEGQNAAIYDVAGRMISNTMVNSDNARFEVAASGVYMVRVNGETMRVVVK